MDTTENQQIVDDVAQQDAIGAFLLIGLLIMGGILAKRQGIL